MPPWNNPAGYLQREVYRLTRALDDAELGSIIERTVIANGSVPRSPTYQENKFHWGLLAVEGAAPLLTPPRRRLFASQMLYADRHNIPEAHLIGFIYQLGSQLCIYDRIERPGLALLYRTAEN